MTKKEPCDSSNLTWVARVQELLETESNYVEVLNMLRKHFIKPILSIKVNGSSVEDSVGSTSVFHLLAGSGRHTDPMYCNVQEKRKVLYFLLVLPCPPISLCFLHFPLYLLLMLIFPLSFPYLLLTLHLPYFSLFTKALFYALIFLGHGQEDNLHEREGVG